MNDIDITSEMYGAAVDALIDEIPTDRYDKCPCGCGCSFKFVKDAFETHEAEFIRKYKEKHELQKSKKDNVQAVG